MSRIAYVNGRYVPQAEACVSIEDRGYQFADGVYEVCEVRGSKIVDLPLHLARLKRSLGALRIMDPMNEAALALVMRETVRRNRVTYGIVYLQVTRGVARRDHAFPVQPVAPAIVVTAKNLHFARNQATAAKGIAVITRPDIRWGRVDIKSIALLPNVLARQEAREQGAYEAWLVDDDGFITEGAASNAWIVTREGVVVTRDTGPDILAGVTRSVLMNAISHLQLKLELRRFTPEEAAAAAEAFVTASSQIVMPVVQMNGKPIGNGQPGPITVRLREIFHQFSVV